MGAFLGTKRSCTMASNKVTAIISSNSVVVFSKTYCPFCKEVKQLLSNLGVISKNVELDVESDGNEIQDALQELTGQRTVPNVFIGGKHMGGCDSTVAKHRRGELIPLLQESGALVKAA